MSWNKPQSAPGEVRKAKRTEGRPYAKGIIAGAVVVFGAALAAWWLWPNAESADGADKRRPSQRIKEVTPAKPRPSVAKAEVKEEPKKREYWEQDTTNGLTACQILKWKHMRQKPPVYTNMCFVRRNPQPYEIFGTSAENEIAMMIATEPGTVIVGTREYGEDFKREFLKSCETPIIPTASDTPYERDLKKMMNQVKIELSDRLRAGEDLGEIIQESRNELMRLWVVKEDLVRETHKILNETAQSEEDIDTCFTALNTMLESKGMSPIELTPMVKENLMINLGIVGKDEQ